MSAQRRTSLEKQIERMGGCGLSERYGWQEAESWVIHSQPVEGGALLGDMRVPFEEGRQMAAAIPGARFIALEGRNHIPLGNEPAFERFFEEIKLFLAQ